MKIYACILAVALGATACGGNRANQENDSTVGTSGSNESGQQVTLAGCLQKGDGNDYILTDVQQSSGAVGTSGTSSDYAKDKNKPNDTSSGYGKDKNQSSDVSQRQMAAAAHSYRLSGDDSQVRDQMRDLVGHQVRVQGTLEDKGDLSHDTAGTAGKSGDIDKGDLAKVEVTSVQSTGPACGAERK
jgi:hypothetical protein